jgi:hypothetical protein
LFCLLTVIEPRSYPEQGDAATVAALRKEELLAYCCR